MLDRPVSLKCGCTAADFSLFFALAESSDQCSSLCVGLKIHVGLVSLNVRNAAFHSILLPAFRTKIKDSAFYFLEEQKWIFISLFLVLEHGHLCCTTLYKNLTSLLNR